MASPDQIRQSLSEVSRKEASLKPINVWPKHKESKQRRGKRPPLTASELRLRRARWPGRTYDPLKSAEKAALAEGNKIAEQSRKIANYSSQEVKLNGELATALNLQAAKERRERNQQEASDKRRREAEQRERDRQSRDVTLSHQREIQFERSRTGTPGSNRSSAHFGNERDSGNRKSNACGSYI